jgi:5-methylthioadenosine/S-adenosylhomocysteine deaminase
MWIRKANLFETPHQSWDIEVTSGRITQLKKTDPSVFKTGMNASKYWITPGFVNAHTHVAMSFMKSLAPQAPNLIRKWMFPIESKLSEEDVFIFSKLGIAESLLGGSTTIFDHYYHPHGVARAAEALGMRAAIAPTVLSTEGPFSFKTLIKQTHNFLDHTYSDLIMPMVGPHATDTLDKKGFQELIELARTKKLPLHLHVSQTEQEFKTTLQNHRCTPIAFLNKLKAFESPILLAHAIYLKPQDLKILKNKNCVVVVCPSSLVLYDKLSPILDFEKHKIATAIGSDSNLCNDTMDMPKELRALLLFQRVVQNAAVPTYKPQPNRILKSSRETPLKVLRKPYLKGKIEIGQAADLLFIRKNSPHLTPCYDPTWSQVMNLHPEDIRHVMVNGNWVVKDRSLVNVDMDHIRSDVLRHSQRLLKRAGVKRKSV